MGICGAHKRVSCTEVKISKLRDKKPIFLNIRHCLGSNPYENIKVACCLPLYFGFHRSLMLTDIYTPRKSHGFISVLQ